MAPYSAEDIRQGFLAWVRERRAHPDRFMTEETTDAMESEARAELDAATLIGYMDNNSLPD